MDKVDAVYLETNIGTRKGRREMRRAIRRLGRYSGKKTLKSDLTEDQFHQFEQAVSKLDVRLSRYQSFRPWFTYAQLSNRRSASTGAVANAGVESVLLGRLNEDIDIRFLDSSATQVEYLAGLPINEQVDRLMAIIKAINTPEDSHLGLPSEEPSEIVKTWLKGDVDTLKDLTASEADRKTAYYDNITVKRNKKWADQINQILEQATGTFLLAAGLSHFVGPDSVQVQLKAHDIETDRLH